MCWWGIWNILETTIYPGDFTMNMHVCLAVGYGLTLFLFIIEEPLAKMAIKMESKGFYYKLLWEDVVYVFVFAINVILWRGAWNTVSTYVFPDFEVGGWICLSIGSILMLSLQVFSYACAHGVAVDGSETGRDAIFPTRYLRVYMENWTKKKVIKSAKSPYCTILSSLSFQVLFMKKKVNSYNGFVCLFLIYLAQCQQIEYDILYDISKQSFVIKFNWLSKISFFTGHLR